MKLLILILLLPVFGLGQHKTKDMHGNLTFLVNGKAKYIPAQAPSDTGYADWGVQGLLKEKVDLHLREPGMINVMLKIILRNKPSYHFYREGYKRGEQYWYMRRRTLRELPKDWFVWDWKIIK